jgi:hypothetical protein
MCVHSLMPSKRKGAGGTCLTSGKKKGVAEKKTPFMVRQISPSVDNMQTPKQTKDKFMLNEEDVGRFKAAAAGEEFKTDNAAFALSSQVMFSMWWPTARIILPTHTHFPVDPKEGNDTLKETSSMGLIRPVSVANMEGLVKAFAEHGGTYDAGHPVKAHVSH